MNETSDPISAASPQPILPLIRVVPGYSTIATDPIDDVIGVYENELVLFRKHRKYEVPVEAGEIGGCDLLKGIQSLGKKRLATWSDIKLVLVSKAMRRGSKLVGDVQRGYELRVHFADGEICPMFFPEREAESVIAALKHKIPERVQEDVHPLPRVRLRSRLRLPFMIFGLIPGVVFFAVITVLLPLFVVEVARLANGRLRRSGARCIAVPLAILALMCLVFGVVSFWALLHAPVFIKFIIVAAGAWLSSWILGQFIGIHVARVVATYDALPDPPERKPNRWQQFLQPYRRYLFTRPISIGCKILGVVAFIAATMTFALVDIGQREKKMQASLDAKDEFERRMAALESGISFPDLTPLLGLIAYIPATALIYLGYRLGLRSADDVLARKAGAPIIYLRSFADDGRNDFNPNGTLATLLGLRAMEYLRFLGPLANANPIRLLRLCVSTNADTAEEQLSQFFRQRGPFIAIGRPGEFLTPGGAARAYLSHNEWQERVREWVAKADLVVLQPSDTAGVWWEIEEVVRTLPEEKLLFCLVNYRGNQHGYEQFVPRFEQIAGVRIPRFLGNRCFLWLERGQARFATSILRWPFSWPFSGCAVDFKRTLSRFLTRKQLPDEAEEPDEGTVIWNLNAVAALLMWLGAAILPGLVIGSVVGNVWARHRLQQVQISARGELRSADFVEYNGPGYRWKLRRAWHESHAPAGARLFTLHGVANAFVVATPVPGVESNAEAFRDLTQIAIKQGLSGTPRMLDQKMIFTNGHPWLETIFDINSKQSPMALRYIYRVTINGQQGLVAAAWTGTPLARDLEGPLREALDHLKPIVNRAQSPIAVPPTVARSKPAARSYTLALDPGWKEVPAVGQATQSFVRDSGAMLSVVIENVTDPPASYTDYAAQFLKTFQKLAPNCETLASKSHVHRDKAAWIVILRVNENGRYQFLTRLFIMENGMLFQVTGVSSQEQSEIRVIGDALNSFEVTPTPAGGQ